MRGQPYRPMPKVDNNLKEGVVFFCKDCEKIVEVKPFGRKFVYRCATCGTKNVAFGTEKSIKNFYRIKGADDTPPPVLEKEKLPLKPEKA